MTNPNVECSRCRRGQRLQFTAMSCHHCAGPLVFPDGWRPDQSIATELARVSLGEEYAPHFAVSSPELQGAGVLEVQVEAGNPSGSFKDRGTALAVAAARALGLRELVIASTGNAGASAAVYAARAGLPLTVVVPTRVSAEKLGQIRALGAETLRVDGDFSAAENQCDELAARGRFKVGSDNPYRVEGTKSIVTNLLSSRHREIPDRIFVPVGTGNLLVAIHKGLREAVANGLCAQMPRLEGVQLQGITPLDQQVCDRRPRTGTTSVASGINVARCLFADAALRALEKSGGRLHAVDDDEILEAQQLLATHEGLAGEATACVGVAAHRAAVRRGEVAEEEHVLCLLTGHFLKQLAHASAA